MIKLLLLELLCQSPMSGYEMKQILEQTDAQRWANILPGSIYNALDKLKAGGYIEISNIEMTGARKRSEYEITTEGKKLHQILVEEALVSPIQFNGALYSGIGVSYQIDSELAVSAIKRNILSLEKEEKEIKNGIKAKSNLTGEESSELANAVIDHMLKTVRLQKQLMNKVMTIIEKKSD